MENFSSMLSTFIQTWDGNLSSLLNSLWQSSTISQGINQSEISFTLTNDITVSRSEEHTRTQEKAILTAWSLKQVDQTTQSKHLSWVLNLALRGSGGEAAQWVEECECPVGYKGQVSS